jgi:LEA14-like dessication related protein
MTTFGRLIRFATLAAALIATAAAVGCASLGRASFGTPTVELKDIRVRGIGLDGGSVDLVLDVYNPNDYRMDATRLSYTLTADTSRVATGTVEHRVTLVNRAHNQVLLPVSFSMKELMGAAEVLLRKGSVDYMVAGDVTVDTPFGSMTRPYKGKARIDNASLIPR